MEVREEDHATVHATEMSTVRMQHGERFVTIWFTGPRGGGTGMMRLDVAEATKLSKALADAVQKLKLA